MNNPVWKHWHKVLALSSWWFLWSKDFKAACWRWFKAFWILSCRTQALEYRVTVCSRYERHADGKACCSGGHNRTLNWSIVQLSQTATILLHRKMMTFLVCKVEGTLRCFSESVHIGGMECWVTHFLNKLDPWVFWPSDLDMMKMRRWGTCCTHISNKKLGWNS